MNDSTPDWLDYDRQFIWHPYSAVGKGLPAFPVVSANGVRLKLADGRELIDGMSSWWSVIHGYNHPVLNQAITDQLENMAHVMFGGLTHEPASKLAAKLVEITPEGLEKVFLADSGSVSVEVAMKMAIQFWVSKGRPEKKTFLSLRNGYHGDTFAAMSVCDPVTGMHSLFKGFLPEQIFADSPVCTFGQQCSEQQLQQLEKLFADNHEKLAAMILEPIVQGTGGMKFYSTEYLQRARALCEQYSVLLITDEIATGFGRSGKFFACEHAAISPDILCLGKSLTGGYMTLAATLATNEVAEQISQGEPGLFMHGPTFMGNPLACAVANANIDLLLDSPWQERVSKIEQGLEQGLAPCREMPQVADVRVLGAIGVVELKQAVDMQEIQPRFVEKGVWVRPFGKLVYLMPPFVISEKDLQQLCQAVGEIIAEL